MKRVLIVIGLICLAGSTAAQSSDAAKLDDITRSSSLGIKASPSPFSLLDLSRLRWSHSYSLSYFSGSGNSGSVGLLSSSMLYDLSSKLTLGLNLSIAHNTGALWGDGSSQASFLPGFWLDFHPSSKFNMSISVQRYEGSNYPFMYRSHAWPRYLSPY